MINNDHTCFYSLGQSGVAFFDLLLQIKPRPMIVNTPLYITLKQHDVPGTSNFVKDLSELGHLV